jgi:hypothetical protein
MIRIEYDGNPLCEYLQEEGLTPGEFSVIAGINQNEVYEIMRGHVSTVPDRVAEALDARSGPGSGARMKEAYSFYREDLRARLQKKR